jgi:4-oxalocrotonate tautomerase family enzyme
MPIVKFHLADKDISDGQIESVIEQATQIYAGVLDSPVERIRVFVDLFAPKLIGVGGKLVSKGGKNAPFFEFIVMKDRTLAQRQAIAEQFTDMLATTLKVDKADIRGNCYTVEPENWSIAGSLASQIRQAEIAARAQSGA